MKGVLKYIGIIALLLVFNVVGYVVLDYIGFSEKFSGWVTGWYGCLFYAFILKKFASS